MAKLEDVFSPLGVIEKDATIGKIISRGETRFIPKDVEMWGTLGDLEKLGSELEILNLFNQDEVVRKINIDDRVCIDVMDGSDEICLDKSTPVFYEPWFMDRGSYLIWIDGQWGKLATEHDPVRVLRK